MIKNLFSFEGRMNRAKYWLYIIAVTILAAVLFAIASGISIILPKIGIALMLIVAIASLWISFSIQIKRWHDLDKSGWMILLNIIPILNIVAFVVTGFFKGTTGSNRFGDDLLEENITSPEQNTQDNDTTNS